MNVRSNIFIFCYINVCKFEYIYIIYIYINNYIYIRILLICYEHVIYYDFFKYLMYVYDFL